MQAIIYSMDEQQGHTAYTENCIAHAHYPMINYNGNECINKEGIYNIK